MYYYIIYDSLIHVNGGKKNIDYNIFTFGMDRFVRINYLVIIIVTEII